MVLSETFFLLQCVVPNELCLTLAVRPQGVLVGRAREEQAAAGSPGEVAELQRKLVTVQEELTEMHRCLLPSGKAVLWQEEGGDFSLFTPDS